MSTPISIFDEVHSRLNLHIGESGRMLGGPASGRIFGEADIVSMRESNKISEMTKMTTSAQRIATLDQAFGFSKQQSNVDFSKSKRKSSVISHEIPTKLEKMKKLFNENFVAKPNARFAELKTANDELLKNKLNIQYNNERLTKIILKTEDLTED